MPLCGVLGLLIRPLEGRALNPKHLNPRVTNGRIQRLGFRAREPASEGLQ